MMEDKRFFLNSGTAIRDRQPNCTRVAAPSQRRIKISIIDLQPDSNSFLKEYIERASWLRLDQWCRPSKESPETIQCSSSDAILFDADAIEVCSGSYIRDLKRRWPRPTVVMFGRLPDVAVCVRCFQAGGDGFFVTPGTRDSFEDTIHSALNGWKPTPPEVHRLLVERFICASFSNGRGNTLTRSEREVISCISLGYIDKDIATARGTSERTVQAITNSIYRKLGVHNRRDAVDLLSGNSNQESENINGEHRGKPEV